MCWVSGGWVFFVSIVVSSTYAIPPEYSCPANEVFTLCVIPCNTCEVRGRCEPAECIPGCDCLPGFFRSDKYHHQCVPEVYCKSEVHSCPANEELKDCVLPCNDCNNRGQCHFEVCTPGCDCLSGYFRNYEGVCIPASLCPPPLCPPDEIYYECLPTCRDTCDNFHLEGPCPLHCRNGCHCKEGYVKNKYGKCVTPSECPPPSCGHYERYSTCADPCKICDPRVKCTHTLCHPGCECVDGYRRDNNGICVLEEQCPGIRCGPYESYSHCASLCNTCLHRGNCSFYSCTPGCDCVPGYLRNESGVCVPESQCPGHQVCRPDQHYYTCIPDCRNTCDAYLNPTINCPTTCRSGCFCREGFLLNSIGQCVPPKDCIPTTVCRSDEQHYPCVPDCKNTCRNYFNPDAVCPAICKPGCFCFEGLVLNNQGQCVYPTQCELEESINCGPDEEYVDTCVQTCERSCEAFLKPIEECFTDCTSGCYCKKGLYRSKDGKCVPRHQCTLDLCKPDEQYYQCVPDCKYACENLNKPGVVCSDKCRAGCFCKEGLYRREEDGRCVPQSECRIVQCQPLEQYYSCYTLCNDTCESISDPYLKCSSECKSGCFCLPQYVKRRDGQCVLPAQCEIKTCPNLKERFYDCVPDCANTCEKHIEAGGTCPVTCKSGCFCKEGLLKRKDGECVPPSECMTRCGPLEKFYDCYSECSHTCSYIHTPSSCTSACKRGCYCLPGLVRGPDGRCVHPFMCFNRFLNIFGRGGLDDATEHGKNETATSVTSSNKTTSPNNTTSATPSIIGRKTPTESKPKRKNKKRPKTTTTSTTDIEPTAKTTTGKPQTISTTIASKSPTPLSSESKDISGRSGTISQEITPKSVPKSTATTVRTSAATIKPTPQVTTTPKNISKQTPATSQEATSDASKTTLAIAVDMKPSPTTPINVAENTTSTQKVPGFATTSSPSQKPSSAIDSKPENKADGVIGRAIGEEINNSTSDIVETTAKIKDTSTPNPQLGNITSISTLTSITAGNITSVSTPTSIAAASNSTSGELTSPKETSPMTTTSSISGRQFDVAAKEKEKVTMGCSKNSPTAEPLSAKSVPASEAITIPSAAKPKTITEDKKVPDSVENISLPVKSSAQPPLPKGPPLTPTASPLKTVEPASLTKPSTTQKSPIASVLDDNTKELQTGSQRVATTVASTKQTTKGGTNSGLSGRSGNQDSTTTTPIGTTFNKLHKSTLKSTPKPVIEDKKVPDSVENVSLPVKNSARPPHPKVPPLTPTGSPLKTVEPASLTKPSTTLKSPIASVLEDNTKELQTGSQREATTVAATKQTTKGSTNSELSGRSGNQDRTTTTPIGTTFINLHKSILKSTPNSIATSKPQTVVTANSSSMNRSPTVDPLDIKTPKFITAKDAPQMKTENDDIQPTTPITINKESPVTDGTVTEKEIFSSDTTKNAITNSMPSFSGRSKSEEETDEKNHEETKEEAGETVPLESRVPFDSEAAQTETLEIFTTRASFEFAERQTEMKVPLRSLVSAETVGQSAEETDMGDSKDDVTQDVTDTTENNAWSTDPIRTKREIGSSTHIPHFQRAETVKSEKIKSIASSYHSYGVPSTASKTVFPTTLSGPFVTLLLILFSASNSSISGGKLGTITIRKDMVTLFPGVTSPQDIIQTNKLEEILQRQYSPLASDIESKDKREVEYKNSPNMITKGYTRGGLPIKV